MPKTLLVTCVLLLAAMAAASTPADNQPVNSSPAMRTYMMPDLSLKTVITFDLPPSGIATAEPDAVGTPPRKRGFCRCSCGFPCATDKDCGGASCDPFISCCERDPQNPDSGWFARELTQASHKRPIPAALLKANCK